MKSFYRFLFLLLITIGCQNHDELAFEPYHFKTEACDHCTKIAIDFPKATDKSKIARITNTAIREEVISLLHFDDEHEITDITSAVKSFESGFISLQEKYEDETTPWEAKIEAEITFENPQLLSILIDAYIFTGGAHGYTSKRFLNFDKKKGAQLENEELITNAEDFQALAEKAFRLKESIPEGKPINFTGFMFEGDSFHLPENIGFTKTGLHLLYNQYEVSSFADGSIELILPYKEIEMLLKPEVSF